MTGTTPVFGWPFERNADAPGVTLRAEAGVPLSEQIEDDLIIVQSALQDTFNTYGMTSSGNLTVPGNLSVGGIGSVQKAWKTATQGVTNSTALVNDNHLFFTTATGGTYLIEVYLLADVGGGSSTSDIKIGWNLPGGSINFGGIGPATTLATTVSEGDARHLGLLGAVTATISFGMTGAVMRIALSGYYPNATAGTVTLRWAQNSAVAVETRLNIGSFLLAHRVA